MNQKIADVVIVAHPELNSASVSADTDDGRAFMISKLGVLLETDISGDRVNEILDDLRSKGLKFSFKKG